MRGFEGEQVVGKMSSGKVLDGGSPLLPSQYIARLCNAIYVHM